MTLTHPDTIPTTTPPSPGDLALTLTAVHAAATAGDLDGYTTGLQTLHSQTRACLHALGAGFTCEACDAPISLDKLTVAPMPATPRPLARTAAAQAYALRIGAHFVTLLPDIELSVSAWQHINGLRISVHSSETDKQRAAELELAGFQRLWSTLGGGMVDVTGMDSGTVYLGVDAEWGDVEIRASVILAPVDTVQDNARTWAATVNAAHLP